MQYEGPIKKMLNVKEVIFSIMQITKVLEMLNTLYN